MALLYIRLPRYALDEIDFLHKSCLDNASVSASLLVLIRKTRLLTDIPIAKSCD